MEADARKQSATEAAETAKMNELRKQANAEEAKGNALRLKAKEIAEKGGGLMTAAGVESTKKDIAGLEGGMVASQAAQAEFASQKQTTKLRLEQEKYQEMITRLEEEKAKLAAHEKAVKETGVKSAEELNQQVDEQTKQAREAASNASGFRGQANSTENAIVRNRGLFGLRQEAAAITTQAGVEGERAKAKQAEEKEAERKQKEIDQAASAGSSLASALSGSGASSQFMSQLNAASGAKDTDALMKLLEQLLPYMRTLDDKTRSKLEKLQSELDDLRSAK
jgi:hypothetical protein